MGDGGKIEGAISVSTVLWEWTATFKSASFFFSGAFSLFTAAAKSPLFWLFITAFNCIIRFVNMCVFVFSNVQLQVRLCRSHGELEVGYPSIEEAKKFLVEANGDFYAALRANYDDRKKKVRSSIAIKLHMIIFIIVCMYLITLLVVTTTYPSTLCLQISKLVEKFVQLRAVKPELGELTWEAATKALSRNDMDVAAACHAVQCEWLHELHDYIFSEYKEVVQTEYENIKKLVKNKDLDLTVSLNFLPE